MRGTRHSEELLQDRYDLSSALAHSTGAGQFGGDDPMFDRTGIKAIPPEGEHAPDTDR
jgi:hypothetical protein